jgi:Ca2+-binding EF-hand superfamily protein
MSDEEIKHSFDAIDSNGNGEISREEFVAAAKDFYFGVEETEVSNAFYGKLLPC